MVVLVLVLFQFTSKPTTKIGLPRAGVHSQPREAYLTQGGGIFPFLPPRADVNSQPRVPPLSYDLSMQHLHQSLDLSTSVQSLSKTPRLSSSRLPDDLRRRAPKSGSRNVMNFNYVNNTLDISFRRHKCVRNVFCSRTITSIPEAGGDKGRAATQPRFTQHYM